MSRLQYLVVMPLGVLLLLLTPIAQFVLVLFAKEMVAEMPGLQHLLLPYSVAAVATVFCIQITIISVLLLLRRIYLQLFYEAPTLKYIDVLTAALTLAGVIPIVVIFHLNWTENANPPALTFLAWSLIVFTPALFIMMRTLRSIYRKAADDHHELEQVV